MDIIFQSGEFHGGDNSFWSDLIIAVVGSAIGAYFTVWTFIRGQNTKNKEESDKKIQFEKDKLKYFSSLLNNTVNTVEEQIKRLDTFCDEIKVNAIEMPLLRSFTFNDLDRLVYKINQEEHFHSYLNQVKDKSILHIFSSLDFCEAIIKQILDINSKAVEFDYQRKLEFTQGIHLLKNAIWSLMDNLDKESIVYKKFDEIMQNYKQQLKTDATNSKPTDLQKLSDNVTMAIVNFSIQYQNLNEYRQLDFALKNRFLEIKYEASRLNSLLYPIRCNNQTHEKNLRQISTSLKVAFEELQDKKKTLDNFIKMQTTSN